MWSPTCNQLSPRCLPIVFQLSSTCHPVVSQLSYRCGLPIASVFQLSSACLTIVPQLSPRCHPDAASHIVSQLPPRCLRLSSCLPLLSQMMSPGYLPDVVSQWSPRCFPNVVSKLIPGIVFHISQLSSRIGLPIVSKCLPLVTQLPFRCCLRLVMSVLQMWSPNRLPIVFHLSTTTPSCLPDAPIWFPNCLPLVSQLPPDVVQMSPNCVPYLSRLSLEFETLTAVGLQSWAVWRRPQTPCKKPDDKLTGKLLHEQPRNFFLHLSDLIRPTKTQTLHPQWHTHIHTHIAHIAPIEPIAAWCCWLWKIETPEC